MVMTLHQFSQIGWREVFKKVKEAVVYIDNEGAECLHWNGGLMQMIRAGALTVKEFSAFEVHYVLHQIEHYIFMSCHYDVIVVFSCIWVDPVHGPWI
jgi:hypothetical protein